MCGVARHNVAWFATFPFVPASGDRTPGVSHFGFWSRCFGFLRAWLVGFGWVCCWWMGRTPKQLFPSSFADHEGVHCSPHLGLSPFRLSWVGPSACLLVLRWSLRRLVLGCEGRVFSVGCWPWCWGGRGGLAWSRIGVAWRLGFLDFPPWTTHLVGLRTRFRRLVCEPVGPLVLFYACVSWDVYKFICIALL